MFYKVKAIILHTLKYGESGIIIHAYTDSFGKQSYLVQGVRKKKSRFNANHFQPLSLLELEVYYKEKRELQRIKEVKKADIHFHANFDIRRSAIAMFIGELLFKSLHEIEPNQNLFDYLFHSVQLLDITDKGLENFHIIFMMQFTKFIGIFPGKDNFLGINNLPDKAQRSMLTDLSLTDSDKVELSAKSRNELLQQMITYYKSHLEGMGEINSLSILHEVFHH